MKTHKEFEKYWSNAKTHIGRIDSWQRARLKDLAFRAWRKGRMYQANLEKGNE